MNKKQLDSRIATYSTAAGAFLAGATANAAVQYTELDLTIDNANASRSLDFNGDGTNDLRLVLSQGTFTTQTNSWVYSTTPSGGSTSYSIASTLTYWSNDAWAQALNGAQVAGSYSAFNFAKDALVQHSSSSWSASKLFNQSSYYGNASGFFVVKNSRNI